MDVEVFNFKSLRKAYISKNSYFDREHVTPYIKKNNIFKRGIFSYKKDYSHLRITIDEKEDLDCIKEIINYF